MKCVSVANIQTMSHNIVDSCPLTKLDGGLQRLHAADQAAIDWLTSLSYNNNARPTKIKKSF